MPFQLNPEAPVLYRSVSEQAVIAEKEPGKQTEHQQKAEKGNTGEHWGMNEFIQI